MACTASWQQIARFGWVCILAFGCALAAWSVADVDRPFVDVDVQGSLRLVNDGKVSPWYLRPIDMTGKVGALGFGTLKSYSGVGEMLSFAGRTFIRTTDRKKGVKLVELDKTSFPSPFAITVASPPPAQDMLVLNPKTMVMEKQYLLAENAFPRVVRQLTTEPELLHSVLERLADEAHYPIAVVGWGTMPELQGTALKVSPIDEQSLAGSEKDRYLDAFQQQGANVVFFAVVAPVLSISSTSNTKLTAEAFDYNPEQGRPAAALIHVHGALVDEVVPKTYFTTPTLTDELRKVHVQDIMHVYGTSTIKDGMFIVYRLNYENER